MPIRNLICALFLLCLSSAGLAANSYDEMLEAVKDNKTQVVAELLKRGLDPNTSDQEGNTLLILASREGSAGVARQLIAAGAKLDAVNQFNETALMMAARGGHVDTVKLLLEEGADPLLKNQDGMTALDLAVAKDKTLSAQYIRVFIESLNLQD